MLKFFDMSFVRCSAKIKYLMLYLEYLDVVKNGMHELIY